MTITRRRLLSALAAGAACLAAPGRALALAPAEAERFVDRLVAELSTLVQSGAPKAEQEAGFRDLFERYAAVPQVTRFVMGIAWRDMTEAQRAAFGDAFLDYVARVYTRLLEDYQGETIVVTGSTDFGSKGVLVTSRGVGERVDQTPIEWLVSDRGGDGPRLVDITAEGVSLLQTQRQEFAAMLDKRNGDVDRFIEDLAKVG